MTQKEFDDGFKLLKRFLKEKHIYNDFLKITAPNKIQYKNTSTLSFFYFCVDFILKSHLYYS